MKIEESKLNANRGAYLTGGRTVTLVQSGHKLTLPKMLAQRLISSGQAVTASSDISLLFTSVNPASGRSNTKK